MCGENGVRNDGVVLALVHERSLGGSFLSGVLPVLREHGTSLDAPLSRDGRHGCVIVIGSVQRQAFHGRRDNCRTTNTGRSGGSLLARAATSSSWFVILHQLLLLLLDQREIKQMLLLLLLSSIVSL
jgi:hypothetical protein